MMKKLTMMFLAGAISTGNIGNVLAEDGGPFAAENFSATLTMTSSYMYRGTSFSDERPALQGSFDWGYSNFFAGVWSTSLVDQDPADERKKSGYELETDFYVGYADSFAGIDWFVMPIYYHFWDFAKRDTGGADADVFEVWLDASKAINDYFSVHAMYAYSPDFFFESGDANYIKGDITANLPYGIGLNVGFGYQHVAGDNPAHVSGSGWSYTHWEVGLTKSLAGFDFDLRYHDTSDDAVTDDLVTNFFGATDNTDDIIVFTVSRSF